jgi:hypothetical protein
MDWVLGALGTMGGVGVWFSRLRALEKVEDVLDGRI